jgi:hypothetical protein
MQSNTAPTIPVGPGNLWTKNSKGLRSAPHSALRPSLFAPLSENTMNNVTQIQTAQQSAQPAPGARFKITAELDGFPVEIEIEGKADNLKSLVERLKAIGAQPPTGKASPSNGSAPNCPVHHKPMKASRKPGTFYCPKRDDDGEYCREKA